MPELEPTQLSAILARKASEDALALRELEGNSEIADSILGFRAQQAIEKWLKDGSPAFWRLEAHWETSLSFSRD